MAGSGGEWGREVEEGAGARDGENSGQLRMRYVSRQNKAGQTSFLPKQGLFLALCSRTLSPHKSTR
eukprot:2861016-Rhodomonas_salina.2